MTIMEAGTKFDCIAFVLFILHSRNYFSDETVVYVKLSWSSTVMPSGNHWHLPCKQAQFLHLATVELSSAINMMTSKSKLYCYPDEKFTKKEIGGKGEG